MAAILVTESLSRRFGDVMAVDSLTLSIERGEVFGLLGRNGSGKTTLIKMLTTLLSPTSGSARIAGFDIVQQSESVRRLIGYVPQALSADGELTGFENLQVFARLYDIPRPLRAERIREGLELMGLSDGANRLVRTYSGGMIRRLEIAQSMLHRPEVLFLDEPTVGLDPVAREAVWEHIDMRRSRYRTTILLTTHYMDEAEQLCARVAILRSGRMVALGDLRALRAAAGDAGASLEGIFAHFTEDGKEGAGGYIETASTRHATRRLG